MTLLTLPLDFPVDTEGVSLSWISSSRTNLPEDHGFVICFDRKCREVSICGDVFKMSALGLSSSLQGPPFSFKPNTLDQYPVNTSVLLPVIFTDFLKGFVSQFISFSEFLCLGDSLPPFIFSQAILDSLRATLLHRAWGHCSLCSQREWHLLEHV